MRTKNCCQIVDNCCPLKEPNNENKKLLSNCRYLLTTKSPAITHLLVSIFLLFVSCAVHQRGVFRFRLFPEILFGYK